MGQSTENCPRRPRSDGIRALSDHETKRREAVWELFHSEVIYLMSHLLVLKEVRLLRKVCKELPGPKAYLFHSLPLFWGPVIKRRGGRRGGGGDFGCVTITFIRSSYRAP